MAISFVGSKTFAHNATSDQSCSLTDLLDASGATVAPAAGDVVFVNYVHAMGTTATRTLAQCTPSGYTNTHGSIIQANDTHAVSMALSFKQMPASPDTTVSIPAAAATTNGVSCTIECWRGVDAATITTTTPTTASGNNTALANPPSISTPSSPSGCVVLGAFGAAAAAGAVFTNSGATPYDSTTNYFRSQANTTGTNDAVSGMGAKTGLGTSTAFDAAITGSTTTNTGSWGAACVVLRPAPTLAVLTGTLNIAENSANASVVGTPTGLTSGSTRSLSNNAGGRFAVNSSTGQITVANTTLLDYEANTSHNIDYVETLLGAVGSPKTTTLTINVTNVNAPAATDWDAGTPTIAHDDPANTTVGQLNKADSTSLAIVGGTNSGEFNLVSGGVFWNVETVTTPLTSGTSTVQIEDTSNGPSGSAEARTDTLSITVTSPGAGFAHSFGCIIG